MGFADRFRGRLSRFPPADRRNQTHKAAIECERVTQAAQNFQCRMARIDGGQFSPGERVDNSLHPRTFLDGGERFQCFRRGKNGTQLKVARIIEAINVPVCVHGKIKVSTGSMRLKQPAPRLKQAGLIVRDIFRNPLEARHIHAVVGF